MSNLLTSTLSHLSRRQSEAELAIESKNEASFFNKYKWLIIGGLFASVIQILAAWWFLNRRRQRKARKADEESFALAKAQTFGNVGVGVNATGGNAWGVNGNSNPNPNVWGVGGGSVGVVRVDGTNGMGVQDVPPAYDGRRDERRGERFGVGGKI